MARRKSAKYPHPDASLRRGPMELSIWRPPPCNHSSEHRSNCTGNPVITYTQSWVHWCPTADYIVLRNLKKWLTEGLLLPSRFLHVQEYAEGRRGNESEAWQATTTRTSEEVTLAWESNERINLRPTPAVLISLDRRRVIEIALGRPERRACW